LLFPLVPSQKHVGFGTRKSVANSSTVKIHASPARRIPVQNNTISLKKQGEGGDAAWRGCVGYKRRRNVRSESRSVQVAKVRKRDAQSGHCVDRCQHMRAVNQVLLVGRGGDAVWRGLVGGRRS
jgi:hypothetical protein